MMTIVNNNIQPSLLLYIILIPFVASILIAIFKKYKTATHAISIIAPIVTFLATLYAYINRYALYNNEFVISSITETLRISLNLEGLGMLFALVASFLWIITSIYAIGYMEGHKEKNIPRFFIFFALSISATLGIAFSSNLLSLFLFYEVLTLCTYPLVVHSGTALAQKSSRVYIGTLMFTSIGFQLPAVLIIYHLFGNLDFVKGGIVTGLSPILLFGLFILYVYGVGKAALMPFHKWLPSAMVAPTPVSALLHAVAVVKSGVFTVIKVSIFTFGIDNLKSAMMELANFGYILQIIAAFTIIATSLVAVRQDNIKKMLAYSTIGQLSYILLAAFMLSQDGMMGGVMHLVAHAFGKITLFFAAGCIMVAAHKSSIREIHGIARAMPITIGAFTIGALSIIGVPPTFGFISKWFILTAAWNDTNYLVIMTFLISTLLNSIYFIRFIVVAIFYKPEDRREFKRYNEAPLAMLSPMIISAVITILLFVFSDTVITQVRGFF